MDDIWLDIWKRRIVRCWTNKAMYFGMHSTSRVEGYHTSMKGWTTSSTGDLLTLHTRMVHWWRNSIHKYKTAVSDALVKTKSLLRGPLFAKVVVVHDHALATCLDNLHNLSNNQGVHSCHGPAVHTQTPAARAEVLEPSGVRIRRALVDRSIASSTLRARNHSRASSYCGSAR